MQNTNANIEVNKEINLNQLGRIFLKRLWLILTVAVVVGLGTFIYSKTFVKPTYRSYFTAYVNNKISDTGVNTSSGDLTASMGLVYVYEDIMTSRSVLQQAAEACGTTYSKVSGCVKASVSDTAPVVKVMVETTDRKLSLRLAQKIAEIAPSKVADVVDGSSMRIIDEPVAPGGKASPNSGRDAITGFSVGFLIATLVLVFIDLAYDTVQGNEEMEQRYSVPVIGHIPDVYLAERTKEHYGYKMTGGNRR